MLLRAQDELRDLIRDRVKRDRPDDAELLADYLMTVLRGMSSSARRGMERERLLEVAELAAGAFGKRLTEKPPPASAAH
jgi:hypothetical protein